MYNVFVNKKLLRIAKKSYSDFDLKEDYSGIIQLERIIENLEDEKYESILLISDDPKNVLDDFKLIGDIRVASGGKVKNTKGEILFIYRDGVWDLPKGFVEKGEKKKEGAIREVEEETGVSDLKIVSKLKTTFHTYRYKGQLVLKISHWYNMTSNFTGKLIPETKEGITDVQWLDKSEIENAMKNTWENIKLLF